MVSGANEEERRGWSQGMLPSQYHVSIHLGKTSARMSQMVLVLKQTTIMSLLTTLSRKKEW